MATVAVTEKLHLKEKVNQMGTFMVLLVIAFIIFVPTYMIHHTLKNNKLRRLQIKDLKARERERRGD